MRNQTKAKTNVWKALKLIARKSLKATSKKEAKKEKEKPNNNSKRKVKWKKENLWKTNKGKKPIFVKNQIKDKNPIFEDQTKTKSMFEKQKC